MRTLAMVLSLLMASGHLFAQATDGNLVVRVTDQTDHVIVGTSLELSNSATGTALRATTDDAGQSLFRNVLPGEYELVVRKDGFSPATLKRISIELNSNATASVKLAIAHAETSIDVVDSPVLIDTTSVQIQAVYQSAQVLARPPLAFR